MSVLRFIVIALVFVALLFIALQNADPVTLRLFTLYSWEAPLAFVVLLAFASGVALGLLAGAIKVVRLKRELARTRRAQRETPTVPRGPDTASGAGYEPPKRGF